MTDRRITDEQLLALAAGEFDGPEAGRIEALAAEDQAAARTIASYRLAKRVTRTDDSVDAPTGLVARAREVFRHRPATGSWMDRLTEVVARIVYDSRLQPAAVRYQDAGTRFQMSFETDEADVDLQAERIPRTEDEAAPRWRVTGQLSADPNPGVIEAVVVTAGRDEPVQRVQSDDRAIFTVDLAPGTYDLRLALAANAIVLSGITIG